MNIIPVFYKNKNLCTLCYLMTWRDKDWFKAHVNFVIAL